MLVIGIFSFSHDVFHPSQNKLQFFRNIYMYFCYQQTISIWTILKSCCSAKSLWIKTKLMKTQESMPFFPKNYFVSFLILHLCYSIIIRVVTTHQTCTTVYCNTLALYCNTYHDIFHHELKG